MLLDLPELIARHRPKDWFCLMIVGFFALLVMLPVAFAGVPEGNDLAQHLRFAHVFYESILTGDFFPGWAGGENFGFGSIGIRYYPPVAYYLMALTQMVTGNWYQTFWLDSFFWMFLGSAGVYFWAKEWLTPWQSVFAAVLYTAVPYHTAQIYYYLLYAEFVASGILPFCFLFATRIARRGALTDVLSFAVAFSLLLLSHIPLTIIGSVGLAVYVLLLVDWKQPRRPILGFSAAFALSLAATAFHWLRAVTEVGWVKHNSPQYYASGYYDFTKFFFPMFLNAGDRYAERILWHLDAIIVFSILLLLPLLIYAVLQIRSDAGEPEAMPRRIIYALAATGLFSIFILSSPSAFVWNSFALLQKTQFPWRWLALTSPVAAVGFTSGVVLLFSNYPGAKKPLLYAGLLLFFSMLLFDISQNVIPSAFMPEKKFEAKLASLPREPECVCWWTVWAKTEALAKREKVAAESRAVQITRWESELREFTIEPGAPVTARIATFYHPHWKAESNGAPAVVEMADDGSIAIAAGAEKTSVRLYFEEPFKLKAALAFSLLTWTFLLGAFVFAYWNRRKSQNALLAID